MYNLTYCLTKWIIVKNNISFPLLFLIVNILSACHFGNNREVRIAKQNHRGYEEKVDTESIKKNSQLSNELLQVIEIPESIEDSTIQLDQILDSVYYIALETDKDNYIGHIDALLFTDSTIIIGDFNLTRSIFIFDHFGRFINKISNLGRGPQEFMSLLDFTYDYITNRIILYDNIGFKIHSYDKIGNYIDSEKIYYGFMKLASLKDDGHLVYNLTPYTNYHIPEIYHHQLAISKPDQTIVSTFAHDIVEFPNQNIAFSNFNNLNGRLLFSPVFSNTIYEISAHDNINAKYKIDLGDRNSAAKVPKVVNFTNFIEGINSSGDYYFPGKSVDVNDVLYFELLNNGLVNCFYSRKTGKLTGGYSYSSSRYNAGMPFFSFPIASYKNYFVAIITPENILSHKETLVDVGLNNSDLPLEFQDIDINDNPILMFYSPKKDF